MAVPCSGRCSTTRKYWARDRRARLRRTVVVTGRDCAIPPCWRSPKSIREFEGKQVLLAYRRDGQPIKGNVLRLVVPGDRHGGRSVRDVVRIELH